MLARLPTLRMLDVSYNSLRKVPTLALGKTARIEQLVLDGNLFLSLHQGTLRNINVINISVSMASVLPSPGQVKFLHSA